MKPLREHVLDDIEDKIAIAIKNRSDYSVGFVHARIIDFALCEIISREELERYFDRLEAAGLKSLRVIPREPHEMLAHGAMRKVVVNVHPTPFLTLSDRAAAMLAPAKGVDVDTVRTRDLARDDNDLVLAVETLGDEAGGEFTKLRVVEIPDNVEWQIAGGGDRPEFAAEVARTWRAE